MMHVWGPLAFFACIAILGWLCAGKSTMTPDDEPDMHETGLGGGLLGGDDVDLGDAWIGRYALRRRNQAARERREERAE